MAYVNVDAAQLARLLQRVDEDSRRMATLESRLTAVESERSASLPPHVSQRRAVSPPAPAPTTSVQGSSRSVGAPVYHFNPEYTTTASSSSSVEFPSTMNHSATAPQSSLLTYTSGYHTQQSLPRTAVPAAPTATALTTAAPSISYGGSDYYAYALRERDDIIDLLRQELSECNEEIEAVKKERDATKAALQLKVDALDAQVKTLIEAIDISTAVGDENQSPSKLYQQQLREKNEVIKTLSEELEAMRDQSAKLMRDTMAAVTEQMTATAESGAAKEAEYQREKGQLEELVAIKQGQVAQLEGRLQSKERRVKELEDSQRELTARVTALDNRAAEANRDADRLRGDSAIAKERLEHLESVSERLKEDLVVSNRRLAAESSAAATLKAERDDALAEVSKAERKMDELMKVLERERMASKGLWKDVRDATEKHTTAASKIEELRKDLAKLQVEADVAKADALRSRDDLKEAYDLIETLRKEKLELGKASVERALLDRQSTARSRLSSAASTAVSDASVASLEERLSALTFTKDIQARELSTLRKQLESVTSDLEAAQNELSNTKRADAVSTLKILRDENSGLRQEVARLSVEWEKSRDEVLRLQQRLRAATGRPVVS